MRLAPQSIPVPPRLTAWIAAALALSAGPLAAQDAQAVRRATAFRKEPGGAQLGMLEPGARVPTGRARGDWVEVTLDGWIYAPSVARTTRDGFDLVVSADGGENLRSAPNGAKVARLSRGALLDRRTTRGRWVQVRRAGWALRSAFAERTAGRRDGASRDTARSPSPQPSVPPSGGGAAAPSAGSAAPDRVATATNALLAAEPGGTGIATLADGAEGEVVARSGEWVKVRIEGWLPAADVRPAPGGALRGVSAAEVRAQPSRYTGQLLEWRLQLVAVPTADALRPELPEGREYLLTRGPLPESGYVYVIVSAPQAARFKGMAPLSEFTARALLRAASTRWLPNPVVELVEVVE
ncbi:MAG TPA: hypothetical protein VLA95_09985 [Gemmatimonadales bacterium]|nr:hypothetical protein [Gemmatimonadales bacterium]